jgi:site-specific DNA-methyltransferase (adenine-specific)
VTRAKKKPKKHAALHSSTDKVYVTPAYLFESLDRMFNFKIDVAASKENAKCAIYYDEESDGLKQSWAPGPAWCNPPYGLGVGKWCEKAGVERYFHKVLTVMLLPYRPDTQWYRRHISGFAFERPLDQRVVFEGETSGAPFPSFLAIWVPGILPVQSEVWSFRKPKS